ncbi:L,D-transpeptidase family protein [Rhizobium sp. 0TCS1.26]|uniref:L,D-transpeptidase family protein n=1 Tax=Rhizobium sp. 0TCS1.26 TaxID=3142623 RepID=UPI003D28C64F
MRLKILASVLLMATALVGCTESIDGAIDLSTVKNKVEQPLPARVVAEMQKKNMPRNSPIMIRVFKEEGVMEIWKAKADNRFDKIAQYQICAWSGKLGPKVKEGDRQAPEGFYNLTPAHLNPNSKYYLAINTGFPNRYDAANGRNGSNLMIHGACSSSGCYSMTDEQILEIYAFARDAFKGGQSTIQLEAFPFRMTAENMARHRNSEHLDFWKMLKVGYDQFEVTKRPPEVNVCDRKYVFNQQVQGAGSISPGAACPPMSTPPALTAALTSYEKDYQLAYTKAVDKLSGKVWYEPTEAERKAVVAAKRKGRDLAYAPTGTSLEAGKLVEPAEFETLMAARLSKTKPAGSMLVASAEGNAGKQGRVGSQPAPQAAVATAVPQANQGVSPAGRSSMSVATAMNASGRQPASAGPQAPMTTGSVPVPAPNPLAYASVQPAAETTGKKPFWKLW